MKLFITIFLTLILMLLSHKSLASERGTASSSLHLCKMETGDIGTVIGRGASTQAAFSNAVEKCFDRRVALFERLRGQSVGMERGQLFIDACVNQSCD